MRRRRFSCKLVLALLCLAGVFGQGGAAMCDRLPGAISLPPVERGGPGSPTDLLYRRRSVRSFAGGKVRLEQLAAVLFAAQGVTAKGRFRAVPSAGALYPLEVYAVVGPVVGLEPGVFRYSPQAHKLVRVASGDRRARLARAAGGQAWIAQAQVVLVISGIADRLRGKYGRRSERYVQLEAGAAAQSASYFGYSVGLGSTVVGAFSDQEVGEVIGAAGGETPLVILPLGLMPPA